MDKKIIGFGMILVLLSEQSKGEVMMYLPGRKWWWLLCLLLWSNIFFLRFFYFFRYVFFSYIVFLPLSLPLSSLLLPSLLPFSSPLPLSTSPHSPYPSISVVLPVQTPPPTHQTRVTRPPPTPCEYLEEWKGTTMIILIQVI